ncbi:hypothetical protein SteCoe_2134 [Stentor coeruleus]|uniref:Aquaporin n=1 Tax=Stentor coeruleus TaxID=5963 RepID=A0A1R2D070_9CILI|nr:hypothetical protein SteCoe_2134 [Stentor coeruleus]
MLGDIKRSKSITFMQQCFSEALGTFMLVFAVGVTQGDPLSVAPTLWAAMIATGFISGAQFNPAVSIAVMVHAILSKAHDLKNKVIMSIIFIIIQLSFGLFGAYIAYFVINTDYKPLMYFDVSNDYLSGEAFLAEVFFTTVLAGCAVTAGNFTKSNILAGGIVATTVSAGDFSIGKYSGGCFNPAVGFGVNMIKKAIDGGSSHRVWLYLLAPSFGGVLAGVFSTFFLHYKKDVNQMRKAFY